jgi:hypothetical protein
MRPPRAGEKPSGLWEETLCEMGFTNWKLEEHEIPVIRAELEKALDEEKDKVMKKFEEEVGKRSK